MSRRISTQMILSLATIPLVVVSSANILLAQQDSLPASLFLGQVVDANGMPPTDPDTPLYRNGTDPLAPITRSNGDPVTLDDYDNATGQIDISAIPGGGTDVIVNVSGLLPNEFYSLWAGYWQDPGFPSGNRVAFGAISAAGDGSDNFQMSDANGNISLNLTQLEGPMTLQGSAPAYAPISPVLDDNGVPQVHNGYSVGVAYHFGDFPDPPYLNPGPANTWALHAIADFAPVPEPSSVVLFVLGGLLLLGTRKVTLLRQQSS